MAKDPSNKVTNLYDLLDDIIDSSNSKQPPSNNNSGNNNNESIYDHVRNGNEDRVRLMLQDIIGSKRKSFVNVRDVHKSNGRTLLHEACANGHLHIVQLLLRNCFYNADIQKRTYLGRDTPLHLAVSSDHRHIVFLLLNYGADPMAQNKYKDTPLHYSRRRSVAALLIQNGARADAININGETPIKAITKRGKQEKRWKRSETEEQDRQRHEKELVTYLMTAAEEQTRHDIKSSSCWTYIFIECHTYERYRKHKDIQSHRIECIIMFPSLSMDCFSS